MTFKSISAKIPSGLSQKLTNHINETGTTKDDVLTEALTAYLDRLLSDNPLRDRVQQLEERLTKAEYALGESLA